MPSIAKLPTCSNEGFPVRVVHRSTSLRQALAPSKRENIRNCTRLNCATAKHNLCFRKNVVYKIACDQCHDNYIGSTIRNLHDRVKEHLTQTCTSSVFNHLNACQRNNSDLNITAEVITSDPDAVNLRLQEAIYIRKHKPQVNSREEYSELYRISYFNWLNYHLLSVVHNILQFRFL